jgi:ssDNA-binding Zn-finger/Zn-ribbon topoisomerase 1
MFAQKYFGFSTTELKKYICPDCGRLLIVEGKTKLVKKSDPDADYWYGRAEMLGVSATKKLPLKFRYADYYCYKCDSHYIEDDVMRVALKQKDKKKILKINIIKHRICPICNTTMKLWLRKVTTYIDLSDTSDNSVNLKNLIPYDMFIPYHFCPNCKHETHPILPKTT